MAKGSWRTDGGLGGISVGAVDEASGTFELHLKDAAGNIVCGTVRGTFTGTTGSFILMGSCPGESLTLKGTLSG